MTVNAQTPKISGTSIRTKLILLFMLLLVAPMLLTTLISLKVLTGNVRRELRESTARSMALGERFLIHRVQAAERQASLLARMGDLRQAIEAGTAQEFLASLQNFWLDDMVEIFDPKGLPLARYLPKRRDVELFHTKPGSRILVSAMDMQSSSDLYTTPNGLAIKAATPILDIATFELKGAVVVTQPVDVIFLMAMKDAANSEVSMASGQGRTASTILGPDGERLEASPHDPAKMLRTLDESGVDTRFETIFDTEYYTLSVPIKNNDGRTAAVLSMSHPAGGITTTANQILGTILISSGVSMILVVLAGFFGARSVLNPLERLLAGVRLISEGDYGHRVDLNRGDELGILAKSFNIMADNLQAQRNALLDAMDQKEAAAARLAESNQELERLNTDLETLVSERTSALSESNAQLKMEIRERALIQHDLELAKAAADMANMAKSEFLAGMSHEIRTPMNAILGMAELLGESDLNTEQRKFVDILGKAGEGLLLLINDILDLSKVEAGELKLETIEFDPAELIRDTCQVMQLKIEQKGLAFDLDISPDIPGLLIGDPARIRQILVNLLGNAIKFTQQGSISVTVSSAPKSVDDQEGDERLLFTVTDTGIGVPKHRQRGIFDKFSQADASTTRRYGGTGLGLAICKRLAEAMGGRVWVDSVPNSGSSFHFTVRTVQAAPQADVRSRAGQAPGQAGPDRADETKAPGAHAPLDILLAEDNENNAMLFSFFLRNTPHKIDIAVNGKDALDMFEPGKYDIVFMDIEMPVMDGYEAVRGIRSLESRAGARPTPVIALTAHALADGENKCAAAGCDGRMTKPFTKAQLFQTLETFS